MALFKPMRAATLPATSFDSPFDASVFWASPKLDGIRAVVREGTIQSRKLKPVPNPLIRGLFEEHYAQLKNLDGELMVQNGTFSDTQSFVMSKTVDEDVRVFFHVFDTFSSPARPYKERYALIKEYLQTLPAHFSHRGFYLYVSLVEQKPAVRTPAELLRVALKDGHEGIMLRRNDATYKFGTATLKNGELMKVKAKYDAEAVIVDILPLKRKNDDAPVETNSLGLRKTVHKKEHFHTVELAGTLIGERPDGTKIKVGVGTALDRQRMWAGRDAYIGQVFTYEYAELTPSGLPRFPVFKGLRHD